MGGGRTGAAVMQLINERGTLATKTAQIAGAENPKTYGSELALAFSEPIVVFHKLEQQFENLTIRIGQDITPALVSFGKALLDVGQWFGKNKGALAALGILAGSIVAGAAVIKTISVGEKIVSGVKYLLGGSSTAGLAGNTGALTLNTGALEALTYKLTLSGGLGGGGIVPGGGGGTALTEEELGAGGLFGLGGKTVPAFLRGAATKAVVAGIADYLFQTMVMPTIRKHTTPQESRTISDMATGAAAGAAIASFIPIPGVSTLLGGGIGGALGALYSLTPAHNPADPKWARELATYSKAHPLPLGPGQRPVEPLAYTVNSPGQFARVAAMMGMPSSQVQRDTGVGPPPSGPWSPAGVYATTHMPGVVAQQAQEALTGRLAGTMGVPPSVASAFVASMTAASKMKAGAGQDKSVAGAETQLIAAAVKQQDAADHGRESANQLSDAAKQETATLSKFLNAASQQTNAANTTQTAAFNLTSAASQLETAAGKLGTAAANAATAFKPANIHSAAVAGTKQSVARK
jgi:hypothetical protein